jgi:heptosyltransferase-2
LTHRLKNPGDKPPMVAFYSALSGEPGIEQDRPRLQLAPAFIAQVLQQHGLAAGGYVVMAPGAEYGPAKRWPHFGGLGQLLRQPVLLLGSGKEAQLCEAIRAQAPERCRNLAGQTSLEEAFALIAGAGSVVSNDSGLMHVAAAFGVPQVALFGSSSPLHTPPLNDAARVVWLKQDPDYLPPLDCAPCFQRDCPLGHLRCLNDVSPERVRDLLPR